jgi:hypothetical protein
VAKRIPTALGDGLSLREQSSLVAGGSRGCPADYHNTLTGCWWTVGSAGANMAP